jgi:membrane-bound metal-dependent hydrolase YbcI (DUF457 family)
LHRGLTASLLETYFFLAAFFLAFFAFFAFLAIDPLRVGANSGVTTQHSISKASFG